MFNLFDKCVNKRINYKIIEKTIIYFLGRKFNNSKIKILLLLGKILELDLFENVIKEMVLTDIENINYEMVNSFIFILLEEYENY